MSAQESVKMSATEIAVFLEGLEQAVRSADLEVGVGGGGLQSRPDMTRSPFHAELQCLSACGDLAVVSGYGSTCQAAHTGQVE